MKGRELPLPRPEKKGPDSEESSRGKLQREAEKGAQADRELRGKKEGKKPLSEQLPTSNRGEVPYREKGGGGGPKDSAKNHGKKEKGPQLLVKEHGERSG